MGVLNNLSTTRRFYLRIWTRINIKKKDPGNFVLLVNLLWDFQFLLGRVARFPFGRRNFAGPMSCMLTANAFIQTATKHHPFVVLHTLNTRVNLGSRVYTGKNLTLR